MTTLRSRVGAWIESDRSQYAIIVLILVSAVVLGLETSPSIMAEYGAELRGLDQAILGVFIAELALKLFAHRAAFWRNPWNVFDFLVVGIALIPSSGPLAVLRTLRVLRMLRLISTVRSLRVVVEALLRAIPGIGSVFALMLVLFYVAAVIATTLFGEHFPDWFGSIGASMYTLFQIMTLESWSMGIVRPVMAQYAYAWAFFVPFILIATFTMLNLFIGIIVSTMQEIQQDQLNHEQQALESALHADTRKVLAELTALRAEVRALQTARGADR